MLQERAASCVNGQVLIELILDPYILLFRVIRATQVLKDVLYIAERHSWRLLNDGQALPLLPNHAVRQKGGEPAVRQKGGEPAQTQTIARVDAMRGPEQAFMLEG